MGLEPGTLAATPRLLQRAIRNTGETNATSGHLLLIQLEEDTLSGFLYTIQQALYTSTWCRLHTARTYSICVRSALAAVPGGTWYLYVVMVRMEAEAPGRGGGGEGIGRE